MIPKAIVVYDAALESDDERVRVAAAMKLLEGFQVLPKGLAELATPEPDREQRRLFLLGEMTELMPIRHQPYGTPLPEGYEELEDEVEKRIEPPN
jgi:hypothetical protein